MLLRIRSMWRSSLKLCNYPNQVKKLVALQFWICYGWIQNKIRFRCIVTNNRCWLEGHSCSRNVVIGCCKLPSLFCRGYFINISNKFGVLFTWLCIWPSLLGWLLRCQKLTNWRYLWFSSFLLLYGYLMERYFCHNKLLKFIIGSFNQLYSLGLRMWLFLWLNHLTNRLLWHF